MSERDTHFRGFAKLLYEDFLQLAREDEASMNEMLAPDDYAKKWRVKVEQRIAQRAYDLVCHAFDGISEGVEALYPDENVKGVSDFTEWPTYDHS